MTSQDTLDKPVEELESVVIRLAGDSGDGMQLTGGQFTRTTALFGNDISTLPDFPAEIRAPAGSLPGVSSFQLNFSSNDIYTPGDEPNVLVAMNPAALKVHLDDLEDGGILLVNTDAFSKTNLHKAGYTHNPLEDGSLSRYRAFKVPITSLNAKALDGLDMTQRQIDRSKNFWALGLLYWLYNRPLDASLRFLEERFKESNPTVYEANKRALHAGYNYGDTTEIFTTAYRVRKAHLPEGTYRNITGAEATAMGFVTGARLHDKPIFYTAYPITPASEVLHEIVRFKHFGVKTFQAEDEIAAVSAAIGAAFGGNLGLTCTSGPGVALKSEAINLAHMVELPLVIADIQRAGPSTGMPTKTEQGDLLQCMFGRNSDSACAIIAPATPGDCFYMAIEAFRLAVKFMTPVFYLSDGYLGNGAEPWRVPSASDLERYTITHPTDPDDFAAYRRDPETLARPWAIPGTPGLEHRIGGLEEGRRHRQRQLRPPQPRTDDPAAQRENRAHRQRHSAARGLRRPGRQAPGAQLGQHLRRGDFCCGQVARAGGIGVARPPALSQPAAEKPRRRSAALRYRADPGTQSGPAPPVDPGALSGGRRRLVQGSGAAVQGV